MLQNMGVHGDTMEYEIPEILDSAVGLLGVKCGGSGL